MGQENKGVGLNPNTYIHLTEHLAPICAIMGIPLLLTDEKHAKQAQEFYPTLQVLLMNWLDVTPEYLMENFNVFFQSQPWPRQEFYPQMQKWETLYNKTMRSVHCPHGFSDKVSWFEKNVWEDILLVYGDKMMDLFKESKVDQHLNATVRTGNYRYLYYRQHQSYYDELVEKLIWSRLNPSNPTILYAPTHNDLDNYTTFFNSEELLKQLPKDYNLIVKIHPFLEVTDEHLIYSLIGKYEKSPNILFLQDFPLIYPLLARTAIYLGDISSIGYDFLAFNRPMFFLTQEDRQNKDDRNFFLHQCGVEIKPEQYKDFYKILESELPFDQERYGAIRKKIYDYTFGKEIPFEQLKQAIIHSYSSPKKWD
jgi:teichoic acid glycerol-phosphate primase